MATIENVTPDWERLLAAERHLQLLLHAGHRISMDGDHVLSSLREKFDDVLATLEAAAGWQTERVQRPVLILGQLNGVMTGIRQLRRTAPLEVEEVEGLRVPTLAEMARIKSWLVVTRHTVRDYLDAVVLFERLGEEALRAALKSFDALYHQLSGTSVTAELADRLASARPLDISQVDLSSYRSLVPPWNDWTHIVSRGRHWAPLIAALAMETDR